MDDLILDDLLDQLPTADRAVVRGLIDTDPAVAARFAKLSAALAPLASDAEPITLPAGLATAAIARTAAFAVENGLFTAAGGFAPPAAPTAHPNAKYRESGWMPALRGWVNAAAAAAVVLLVAGLAVTAVGKARQQSQTAACQNNLRELHNGLAGYGGTHGGRLPVAVEVFDELARTGQSVSVSARRCPTVFAPADGVGYSYSLGFRDSFGHLVGPFLPDPTGDATPVAADLPSGSRHGGWNVLTVGGGVRFTRTSTLPNGDDIFRNDDGHPQPGRHRLDVCLGRPFDVP